MPIIELPKEIASKIAAGEVVERPVSVVKELVENSIDAGANRIIIRVEGAGKRLIEIEDNGSGILSGETKIALKRYATSKISSIKDLSHIRTLGFRGEALASIAAISRFTLTTRTEDEAAGIQMLIEGGEEISSSKIGFPTGTKIRVENLFFNVPARLKFLKKEITERRLISELISRYALIYPQISFHLFLEKRNILVTSGGGNRREILQKIYDVQTARDFLEIKFEDGFTQISGFISPFSLTRSNRKEIYFSVNGRLVGDSTLTAAVIRAYQGLIMVGRFPIVALCIQIPPEKVDVNVHPAKAEIKFQQPDKVFSGVHGAVRKTLSAFSPLPDLPPTLWQAGSGSRENDDTGWPFLSSDVNADLFSSQDEPRSYQIPQLERIPLLRPIGQLGNSYIAAEGPDGLYLIDQHAAHERVLFEKFLELKESERASQYLLEPLNVHLSAGMSELLDSRLDILNKIGFDISCFGPDVYKITALPAVISHMDPKEAVFSSIDSDEEDKEFIDQKMENKLIAKICKRAAVKGGQTLSFQEQSELVRELENCESPRTCPHGRPTMIHLSVNMLEKQFGRRGNI